LSSIRTCPSHLCFTQKRRHLLQISSDEILRQKKGFENEKNRFLILLSSEGQSILPFLEVISHEDDRGSRSNIVLMSDIGSVPEEQRNSLIETTSSSTCESSVARLQRLSLNGKNEGRGIHCHQDSHQPRSRSGLSQSCDGHSKQPS
jgi:hypothetical protein